MKRFVVVGLGIFGSTTAEFLHRNGHEVIALDIDDRRVDLLSDQVTRAIVGDGRNSEILSRAGAKDSDAAVVSTGQDIGASILAALALNDIGIREIYVKVISNDHARIVRRFQGTEPVFPEHESGLNLASRMIQSRSVLNYVHLGGGVSLQEMAVPVDWEGKSLRELSLRARFQVSIVAIHDVIGDVMTAVPDPDRVLRDTDTLVLSGSIESLNRVAELK